MTFDEWLFSAGMDDETAAKLFDRDRTHISKLRRRKARPSYELMVAVREASGGKVSMDSWAADAKMARAG